jgi:hypothetical protein
MVNDVTILYDRWLHHPEHGVAAMLALVPRVRPGEPDITMPTVPTIYNDVEDQSVAREIDPAAEPALVIFTDSDPVIPMHPNRRPADRRLTTTIAYTTREMEPVQAIQWGGVILRAVAMTLRRFNDQSLARDYREVNGIKIMEIETVREQRVSGAVGRSKLWGFLLSDAKVLDTIL